MVLLQLSMQTLPSPDVATVKALPIDKLGAARVGLAQDVTAWLDEGGGVRGRTLRRVACARRC